MAAELTSVIKLLDDPDPSVKKALEGYFSELDGDLSEHIAGEAVTLTRTEKKLLSYYLLPGRRKTLADNWLIPERFQQWNCTDYDTLEHLLSLLSDYLHDGISLRPSLPDSIDQLVDEVHLEGANRSVEALSRYLFKSGRFMGNRTRYFAKENSDLVWVIHNTIGNPVSLVILFMILGKRFGLEIEGCNYPGHFLARIPDANGDYLIDAYNRGRILDPQKILEENPSLSKAAEHALSASSSLCGILKRIVHNIENSLAKEELTSEIPFIQSLQKSLFPIPML